MRRYSLVFLIIALFCFLFPFTVITPTADSGVFPMTGWDMLTSQNISVSKQPPIILNIPLRAPMLLAVLCGVVAILVRLARRADAAWVAAAGTVVAAISLLTVTASIPLVQLTDGQTILHRFENPGVQLLPAFYISLALMGAAAVSSLMSLQKRPTVQLAAGFPTRPPATFAATAAGAQTTAPARSTSASPSFPSSSFCIKCGSGLAAGARFCNRCGTTVPAAIAVAKAPVVPTPAVETASVIAPPALTEVVQAEPAPQPVPQPPPPAVTQEQASAATSVSVVTTAVVPTPTVATAPSPVPVPRIAMPRVSPSVVVVPPVSPHGFSAGAKLGLAAATLMVAAAAWFAFHPSTNNSASVAAPTAISVYPVTMRVAPGGTVQLQAMVTGGTDREIQWSIQEGTSGGSIEPAGATVQNGTVFLLANYKAPLLPGIYHVIAVSTADQTRKAVAQIMVEYSWSRRY